MNLKVLKLNFTNLCDELSNILELMSNDKVPYAEMRIEKVVEKVNVLRNIGFEIND